MPATGNEVRLFVFPTSHSTKRASILLSGSSSSVSRPRGANSACATSKRHSHAPNIRCEGQRGGTFKGTETQTRRQNSSNAVLLERKKPLPFLFYSTQ